MIPYKCAKAHFSLNLPDRLKVGRCALDAKIGVRIPVGQPIRASARNADAVFAVLHRLSKITGSDTIDL